ncbi:MAG TPA: hypothetical protein VIU43_08505 [Nitrosospira sp.]
MTKYATFDTNSVLNGRYDSDIHASISSGATALSDDLFFRTINETDGLWKLVNGVVTKTAFPVPAPIVPTVISMRQARLALYQSGYLSQVNTLISSADEPSKITWDYSSEVRRSHPLVAVMAAQLPLTPQQIDDLFTLAASL